jgi:hypothetical protein
VLLDDGADLFSDELSKGKSGTDTDAVHEGKGKVKEKVFEIERTVLMRRRR